MIESTAAQGPEDTHERLGFTLCLALALHAVVILGVGFEHHLRTPPAPTLEVTLAHHQDREPPDQADFLAQHDQKGSGTLEEAAMLTTLEQADFQDNLVREVSPLHRDFSRPQPDARTPVITTRAQSSQSHPERQSEPSPEGETGDLVTPEQRAAEIAALEARLDTQVQAYAKRPRIRRLTSVSTRRSEDAEYLYHWRSRVEAVGNRHYPEDASRRQIYGDLRLMVSLLPNGEILEVRILQSSGHRILDEAAVRIVHQAAPYPPFPAELQRQVDVLEIIRTWRFHRDQLSAG